MFYYRYIQRYVLCKGCNYPELRMSIQGKDLKSQCNSCGKSNTHDAMHKSGKAYIKYIKSGEG